MATWTDITDAVLEPDKPARSIDALALRDNAIHLAENMIGNVIWHAANAPPVRTLECDGAAVSRTTYADLFAEIGTVWGVGDGSTTFNLPDLRGEFIRGWDNGKGTDSGRGFGSSQGQAFLAHTHTVAARNIVGSPDGAIAGAEIGVGSAANASGAALSTGGAETRPRNWALMPCIVYKGTGE